MDRMFEDTMFDNLPRKVRGYILGQVDLTKDSVADIEGHVVSVRARDDGIPLVTVLMPAKADNIEITLTISKAEDT